MTLLKYNNMSLKAESLKKNDAQRKAIKREINQILRTMDDELKVAHESGKYKAHIKVPINFAIPFMTNKAAQRHIYSEILKSLISRGFHPNFETGNTYTVFWVSWLSDEEKKEIDMRNALLAKYTKKSITRDIK